MPARLKIDEEYKGLIPPLSKEEYKALEESIIEEGCRDPICVWHSTIVDGHNRYEICMNHQIPYEIRNLYFKNRQEAIVWICMTQLSRRNITDTVRRYLIGKRYEAEKILGAHNAAGTNQYKEKADKVVRYQNDTRPRFEASALRTREKLSAEYHIGEASIGRYGAYARAIDFLQEVIPDITEMILGGTLKINQPGVIALADLPAEDILKVRDILKNSPGGFIPYSVTRMLIPKKKPSLDLPSTAGAIKEMPAYDPDAEVRSLTLTIPSWSCSIERIMDGEGIRSASRQAKEMLSRELQSLLRTTSKILENLKEDHQYE